MRSQPCRRSIPSPPPPRVPGSHRLRASKSQGSPSRGLTRSLASLGSPSPAEESLVRTRNIRERHLARVHVHAAELGAAVQRREDLAGIEQALAVERAFEALLLVEVDLREHDRHEVAFLDADAMLTGQHAADLDAQPQDIGAEFLGALELAGRIRIVENERMQVAVAGVEDVGDAQAVFRRQFLHAAQARAAASRAGWCRPCSNSRARCGRQRETPPCGRPRTTAAPPRNWTRGRSRRGSRRAISWTASSR